jgi:hypothetical protein
MINRMYPVCHMSCVPVLQVPGTAVPVCLALNLNEHVFFQKIDLPANYCAR